MANCLRAGEGVKTCKELEEQGLTPEELCMNCANDFRADLGQTALDAFAEASGVKDAMGYTDEIAPIMADLLADVMHYCRREGVDFSVILQQSQQHYEAEIRE